MVEAEELEEWQRTLKEYERILLLVAKYEGGLLAKAKEMLNIIEFRLRYKEEREDED